MIDSNEHDVDKRKEKKKKRNIPWPSVFSVLSYTEPEHRPSGALMSDTIFNVHIEAKHCATRRSEQQQNVERTRRRYGHLDAPMLVVPWS